MWGYELIAVGELHGSIDRYESPCGVMSRNTHTSAVPTRSLRIPMWGYEVYGHDNNSWHADVTNPHVGL